MIVGVTLSAAPPIASNLEEEPPPDDSGSRLSHLSRWARAHRCDLLVALTACVGSCYLFSHLIINPSQRYLTISVSDQPTP